MGSVIAVTSGKGGTGKTTLTAGIATALSLHKKLVLCIDFDIGLRNLDIPLGLTDRALMDFSDVIAERCSLLRAAVSRSDLPNLSLITAPLHLDPSVTEEGVREMLANASRYYDYVLLDAAAGIGTAFQLATCAADRAIVVSTADSTSLRDAQRTVTELAHINSIHLVVNRVQPKLIKRLHTTIDAAMDTAGLPLIGVVPEDPKVMLAANTNVPLLKYEERGAAIACNNIARRIMGEYVPLMRIR